MTASVQGDLKNAGVKPIRTYDQVAAEYTRIHGKPMSRALVYFELQSATAKLFNGLKKTAAEWFDDPTIAELPDKDPKYHRKKNRNTA